MTKFYDELGIYDGILRMVGTSASHAFQKGLNYDDIQNTIVECATKIYIKQMELEKKKLKQEYDELYDRYEKLYEAHERLSYNWEKLKEENKELHKKCSELLEQSNRNDSEPVERRQTLNDCLKQEKGEQ